jgi:hypothetical protein
MQPTWQSQSEPGGFSHSGAAHEARQTAHAPWIPARRYRNLGRLFRTQSAGALCSSSLAVRSNLQELAFVRYAVLKHTVDGRSAAIRRVARVFNVFTTRVAGYARWICSKVIY